MTIAAILQVVGYLLLLMILHETGHVIFAKTTCLSIHQVGFQLKPYPHFFVAVEWPKSQIKSLFYLFSGTFVTIILFIIAYIYHWFGTQYLYYAFVIQLIIETNPFYSDFTIAVITKNEFNSNKAVIFADLYMERFLRYQYTFKWYLHFLFWIIFIIILIKYNLFYK